MNWERLVKLLYHNNRAQALFHSALSDKRLLEICIKASESDRFVTFHERPKKAEAIGTWSDPSSKEDDIAIVVQGPLDRSDDFTLESVKLYRAHYPKAIMVVSTWDTEDQGAMDKIRLLGVDVVQRALPPEPGLGNVNYQIASTTNGLLRAKSLGARYAIKTRTDQRFFSPNTLSFLREMLNLFPIEAGHGQECRLIGCSFNTFKYRLYGVSDMFTFGHIDDSIKFWSPPMFSFDPGDGWIGSLGKDARSRIGCAEMYLTSSYLRSLGREIKWTLRDSWDAYAKHFLIVDTESLDLLWHKYLRNRERRYQSYDGIKTDQELSFKEWLLLHQNHSKLETIPEDALAVKYPESINKDVWSKK